MKRLASELHHSYGTKSVVLPKDLSKPNAADELFRLIRKKKVSVDVLVNNAGFGTFGSFVESDAQNELNLIQVNITALTHLTRLFVNEMIKRGRGKILNVASTAAFQPGPMMSTYYASKSYILSFSEALNQELRHTGVTASCLCPGPTATEFHKRAHMDHVLLVRGALMMEAATVAEIAYKGLMNGKRVIIPGLLNKIGTIAVRVMPRVITMAIIQFLHSRK